MTQPITIEQKSLAMQGYQWFPNMVPAPGVSVQPASEGYPSMAYCYTATGPQRIHPGYWVIKHPELGFLCIAPELFSIKYAIPDPVA